MVMQVLVLAVQNAVEYKDLGVATSGATLFRSVGGSVGVAILGSIFSSRLKHNLAVGLAHSPAAAKLPASELAKLAGAAGNPAARARKHFERAMALARGTDASPLVAFAEAVTIQKQGVKEFESLLNQALAINPDANPDLRLLNTVMQRRARWLLSRESELFLVESK